MTAFTQAPPVSRESLKRWSSPLVSTPSLARLPTWWIPLTTRATSRKCGAFLTHLILADMPRVQCPGDLESFPLEFPHVRWLLRSCPHTAMPKDGRDRRRSQCLTCAAVLRSRCCCCCCHCWTGAEGHRNVLHRLHRRWCDHRDHRDVAHPAARVPRWNQQLAGLAHWWNPHRHANGALCHHGHWVSQALYSGTVTGGHCCSWGERSTSLIFRSYG